MRKKGKTISSINQPNSDNPKNNYLNQLKDSLTQNKDEYGLPSNDLSPDKNIENPLIDMILRNSTSKLGRRVDIHLNLEQLEKIFFLGAAQIKKQQKGPGEGEVNYERKAMEIFYRDNKELIEKTMKKNESIKQRNDNRWEEEIQKNHRKVLRQQEREKQEEDFKNNTKNLFLDLNLQDPGIIPEEGEQISTIEHSHSDDTNTKFENKFTTDIDAKDFDGIFDKKNDNASYQYTEDLNNVNDSKNGSQVNDKYSKVTGKTKKDYTLDHTKTKVDSMSRSLLNITPKAKIEFTNKDEKKHGSKSKQREKQKKLAKKMNQLQEKKHLDFTPKDDKYYKVGALTKFLKTGKYEIGGNPQNNIVINNNLIADHKRNANRENNNVQNISINQDLYQENVVEDPTQTKLVSDPNQSSGSIKHQDNYEDDMNFSFHDSEEVQVDEEDCKNESREWTTGENKEPMDLRIFQRVEPKKKNKLPQLAKRNQVYKQLNEINKDIVSQWDKFNDKTFLQNFDVTKISYKFLKGYENFRSSNYIKSSIHKSGSQFQQDSIDMGYLKNISSYIGNNRFSATVMDNWDLPLESQKAYHHNRVFNSGLRFKNSLEKKRNDLYNKSLQKKVRSKTMENTYNNQFYEGDEDVKNISKNSLFTSTMTLKTKRNATKMNKTNVTFNDLPSPRKEKVIPRKEKLTPKREKAEIKVKIEEKKSQHKVNFLEPIKERPTNLKNQSEQGNQPQNINNERQGKEDNKKRMRTQLGKINNDAPPTQLKNAQVDNNSIDSDSDNSDAQSRQNHKLSNIAKSKISKMMNRNLEKHGELKDTGIDLKKEGAETNLTEEKRGYGLSIKEQIDKSNGYMKNLYAKIWEKASKSMDRRKNKKGGRSSTNQDTTRYRKPSYFPGRFAKHGTKLIFDNNTAFRSADNSLEARKTNYSSFTNKDRLIDDKNAYKTFLYNYPTSFDTRFSNRTDQQFYQYDKKRDMILDDDINDNSHLNLKSERNLDLEGELLAPIKKKSLTNSTRLLALKRKILADDIKKDDDEFDRELNDLKEIRAKRLEREKLNELKPWSKTLQTQTVKIIRKSLTNITQIVPEEKEADSQKNSIKYDSRNSILDESIHNIHKSKRGSIKITGKRGSIQHSKDKGRKNSIMNNDKTNIISLKIPGPGVTMC